jgi:hypothetical protein
VTRKANQHALARQLIPSEPTDLQAYDDGGPRNRTRTDIVVKPAKPREALVHTPDTEDPTIRMTPDRVMALLKAQDASPEPLEPTSGQSPTCILDPREVANAQQQPAPEAKRPFEVVESLPARPPRIPSEFATVPAVAIASERPRIFKPKFRARVARTASLVLMAVAVFSTTFVVTRTMKDEKSRTLWQELVTRWYDGAASRVQGWLGSASAPPKSVELVVISRKRAAAPPSATAAASSPQSAPSASAATTATAAVSAPPVVRLEDLKPLGDCVAPDCNPELPKEAERKREIKARTRPQ